MSFSGVPVAVNASSFEMVGRIPFVILRSATVGDFISLQFRRFSSGRTEIVGLRVQERIVQFSRYSRLLLVKDYPNLESDSKGKFKCEMCEPRTYHSI